MLGENTCKLKKNSSQIWLLSYNLTITNLVIMDVRVGLERKLSTEELMLLSCGVGEDS